MLWSAYAEARDDGTVAVGQSLYRSASVLCNKEAHGDAETEAAKPSDTTLDRVPEGFASLLLPGLRRLPGYLSTVSSQSSTFLRLAAVSNAGSR